MGNRLRVFIHGIHVDGGDRGGHEDNIAAVGLCGGPQSDWETTEGLRDTERPRLEAEPSSVAHPTDDLMRRVDDLWQSSAVADSADAIALGRRDVVESFVRPLVIVDVAEAIEGRLTVCEIAKALALEELDIERSMKTLILAERLRMKGPTVHHTNAESCQPYAKRRPLMFGRIAPGRAVVDENCLRQAVAFKYRHQAVLHCLTALIAAGGKRQIKTRMVVQHRERMAAASLQRKVSLEVHLPKIIRSLVLEPHELVLPIAHARAQHAVPVEYRGDRRRRRQVIKAQGSQSRRNLAAAPSRMLGSNGQNRRLCGCTCLLRAAQWSRRAISQACHPFRHKSAQHLVSSLRTDFEPPAQLPPVGSGLQCQLNKLASDVHHGSGFPWHVGLQNLTANVLPM